jgi:hypothetical protein
MRGSEPADGTAEQELKSSIFADNRASNEKLLPITCTIMCMIVHHASVPVTACSSDSVPLYSATRLSGEHCCYLLCYSRWPDRFYYLKSCSVLQHSVNKGFQADDSTKAGLRKVRGCTSSVGVIGSFRSRSRGWSINASNHCFWMRSSSPRRRVHHDQIRCGAC